MLQSKKEKNSGLESGNQFIEPLVPEKISLSEDEKPDPPSLSVKADEGKVSENNHLPPLNELRGQVIKALREDRHSLAAAMEKSEVWHLNENELSLTFNSPFESTFIEKECREIERIVKKALGWDILIKTVINEKKEASLDEELEEQVELIRTIFRGTIINRS